MNYQKAYLTIFNQLSSLITQLESLDSASEHINVPFCLKSIQRAGEEACIAETEPTA